MNFLDVQNGSFGVGTNMSEFHRGKLKFCLKLHHLIPVRSYVGSVIEQCDEFISELLIPRLVEELRQKLDPSTFFLVKHVIESYKKPFQPFSTEKKRFNIFRSQSVYVDPESFRIGERPVRTLLSGGAKASLTLEPVFAIHIPLIRSLQTFFQLPGVYDATVAYLKELSHARTITNYRQALMWQTHYCEFSKRENAFNLEVWYDDLQPGNGFGSAAGEQKIGGVFVRCPCLPPQLVNKLYSLFATVIFYSKQREEFGNECAFCKLIQELQILHDIGLKIVINGEEKTLYFALTQLIGDNLALNCSCGFSRSFNAKNYCRCCTATAEECRKLTREVPALVRTAESYDEIILRHEFDDNHPVEGIIEECVWNKVPIFNIGNNHYGDVMHDVSEGVCDYTIGGVLFNLIFKDKCFTVDDFNKRLEAFDFGPHEMNRPRKINVLACKDSKNRGKTSKIRLRQSAAEMLCLTRYLGLIIGDLVPEGNKNWKLYLKLRQIVDIVTAPSITPFDSKRLGYLVAKHNELYIKLIGPLKPKMHFLTHYPRLLLQNGPLVNSWGMPFERKNKELKEVADATKCNKNLPLTIAINNQLNACYTREFCEGIGTDYQKGPSIIGDVNAEVRTFFPNAGARCIQRRSSVQILGKNFSEGTAFLADIVDPGDPYFGEVKGIYDVSGETYILASMLETSYFCDHYHAFLMSGKELEVRVIHIDDVPRIDPMLKMERKEDGTFYLASRYGF